MRTSRRQHQNIKSRKRSGNRNNSGQVIHEYLQTESAYSKKGSKSTAFMVDLFQVRRGAGGISFCAHGTSTLVIFCILAW